MNILSFTASLQNIVYGKQRHEEFVGQSSLSQESMPTLAYPTGEL